MPMPRQSRIDTPGALHHIMIRGIERKDMFCYWAVQELGVTATALAGKLGLTQSVSKQVGIKGQGGSGRDES